VEIGRRRIAAIGAHPYRGTAALRLAGYREAIEEAGLPELVRRRITEPSEEFTPQDVQTPFTWRFGKSTAG